MATDHFFLPRDVQSWTDIPTALLRAELARRNETPPRPICGSKNRGAYNLSIHVVALFVILILSVAACAFPIAAKRFPHFPVPHLFLFLSRHFGTGVLIATAFVHLFPTAYISLTDPCLPPFWNKKYPAMPGLIAMTSVFLVVGIEMFFAMRGAKHSHGSGFESLGMEDDDATSHTHHEGHKPGNTHNSESRRSFSFRRKPPDIFLPTTSSTDNLMAGRSPSIGHPSPLPPSILFSADDPSRTSIESTHSVDGLELEELNSTQESGLLNGNTKRSLGSSSENSSEETAIQNGPDRKALLQCLLLEAGILFHSIFIGMALSVTPAPAFYVLLLAISFHQTFEGLALGSRISALAFPAYSPQPWLMALAYGMTTPIGQAIGLAIHGMYDPASETGLLSVGIMNAISSGLLLFAGMVELLAADFLSEESFQTLKGRRRYQACASVVGGALLMALVGAWA
ncbi:Zinc/iron permease [Microthyrium microscopicum]|uniref:Zinc/iron permease n=1 Tax=Microthyrium microscopicum TaxID=703497 RepID=A0A6A6US44_9PEZI|nr:Zinc/iron permease [Microthyrium microscopicum]